MIRPAAESDAPLVRKVHLAAFPTPAEADLVDQLLANGHLLISLVACAAGQVVGHIGFSPVSLADTNLTGVGLAPVAVLPADQQRGWGSKLIRAGLQACRTAGVDYVVVLGAPDYYQRFGFQPASNWGLQNEYGAGDAFMALPLTSGSLGTVRGVVRYGEEFRML